MADYENEDVQELIKKGADKETIEVYFLGVAAGMTNLFLHVTRGKKGTPMADYENWDFATVEDVQELIKKGADKETIEAYFLGVAAGMKRYAWWKDGQQWVGTTGTSLMGALQKNEKLLDRVLRLFATNVDS